MISKNRYYEKRIHKLNKRLARMKRHPQSYTNYQNLYDKVMLKIESYTKAVKH